MIYASGNKDIHKKRTIYKKPLMTMADNQSQKPLAAMIGNRSMLGQSSDGVIQGYIYNSFNGHAAQGFERHHIMPSEVLEYGVDAYFNAPINHRVSHDALRNTLGTEFNNPSDVIDLPIAIHDRPHPNYNNAVFTYIGNGQGVVNMIVDILNSDVDVEENVMGHFKNRVEGDLQAGHSIDY